MSQFAVFARVQGRGQWVQVSPVVGDKAYAKALAVRLSVSAPNDAAGMPLEYLAFQRRS